MPDSNNILVNRHVLPTYNEYLNSLGGTSTGISVGVIRPLSLGGTMPTLNLNTGLYNGGGLFAPMGSNFGMPFHPFIGTTTPQETKPKEEPKETRAERRLRQRIERKIERLKELGIKLNGSEGIEITCKGKTESENHTSFTIKSCASSAGGFVVMGAAFKAGKAFRIRREIGAKRLVKETFKNSGMSRVYELEHSDIVGEASAALEKSQLRINKKWGNFRGKGKLSGDQIKEIQNYQKELQKALGTQNQENIIRATRDLEAASSLPTGWGYLDKTKRCTSEAGNAVTERVNANRNSEGYEKGITKSLNKANKSGFRKSAKSAGKTFKGFMMFEAILRIIPDIYKSFGKGSEVVANNIDINGDGVVNGKDKWYVIKNQAWQSTLGAVASAGGYAVGDEIGKVAVRSASKGIAKRAAKRAGIKTAIKCAGKGAKLGARGGWIGAAIGAIVGIVAGCVVQQGSEALINNCLVKENALQKAQKEIDKKNGNITTTMANLEEIDESNLVENKTQVTNLKKNAEEFAQIYEELASEGLDVDAMLKEVGIVLQPNPASQGVNYQA